MHALEGLFKVFLEIGERAFERGATRDKHVIVAGAGRPGRDEAQSRPQAAPDSVPDHGIAERLRNRKPEAWRCSGNGLAVPRLGLEHERSEREPRPASKSEEFCSFLESDECH